MDYREIRKKENKHENLIPIIVCSVLLFIAAVLGILIVFSV